MLEKSEGFAKNVKNDITFLLKAYSFAVTKKITEAFYTNKQYFFY